MSDKPSWLRGHPLLTQAQISDIDTKYRKRAQSVEAVDDLIATIEARLQRDGVAGNTYIFFSSDNGLHMGDHRLTPGKLTAFETDIHVPLVVAGPNVLAGQDVARVAENVDLYPTFVRLGQAGKAPQVGREEPRPAAARRACAELAGRRAHRAPRAGLRSRSRAGRPAARQRESPDVRGAATAALHLCGVQGRRA